VGGLEASLNLNSTTKIARLPTLVCGSPTDPRPTNACVAAAPYGTLRDYGRVRATGGYLVSPNLLAFLSAGAVFGHGNPFGFAAGVNTDNGTTAAAASVNLSHTQKDVIGWTLGGGLEGKINDHLSLRMEYIYDRFPSISTQTVNISGTATPPSGSMATISAINSGSARFSQQSTMISLVYSY
jgi:opacity protein-like surface antigen